MSRYISVLPRITDAPNGKPVRPEAPGNQQLMKQVLNDPSLWTPELAQITAEVFDTMAATWVDERGGYRAAPLIDALDRGRPPATGRCLEIGSGTGVLTPYLQQVWGDIICVDLSMKMMQHQPTGRQVQADASRLPFPENAFQVIVIGDAPLFAEEVVRDSWPLTRASSGPTLSGRALLTTCQPWICGMRWLPRPLTRNGQR